MIKLDKDKTIPSVTLDDKADAPVKEQPQPTPDPGEEPGIKDQPKS